MLDKKKYRTLDQLFPFIAPFMALFTHQATRVEKIGSIMTVHSIGSKLLLYITKSGSGRTSWQRYVSNLRLGTGKFEKLTSKYFEAYWDTGLYMLKDHSLDHLAEDVSLFDALEL